MQLDIFWQEKDNAQITQQIHQPHFAPVNERLPPKTALPATAVSAVFLESDAFRVWRLAGLSW